MPPASPLFEIQSPVSVDRLVVVPNPGKVEHVLLASELLTSLKPYQENLKFIDASLIASGHADTAKQNFVKAHKALLTQEGLMKAVNARLADVDPKITGKPERMAAALGSLLDDVGVKDPKLRASLGAEVQKAAEGKPNTLATVLEGDFAAQIKARTDSADTMIRLTKERALPAFEEVFGTKLHGFKTPSAADAKAKLIAFLGTMPKDGNGYRLLQQILTDPTYEVIVTTKNNYNFDYAQKSGTLENGEIRRVGGYATHDKKIYVTLDSKGNIIPEITLEEVYHQLISKNYNQPDLKIPVPSGDVARKRLLFSAIEGDMTKNKHFDVDDFCLRQYRKNEYPAEGPVKMLVEMAMAESDPKLKPKYEAMRQKYPRLAYLADLIVADQKALDKDGRLPALDADAHLRAMEAQAATAQAKNDEAQKTLDAARQKNAPAVARDRDLMARLRPGRQTPPELIPESLAARQSPTELAVPKPPSGAPDVMLPKQETTPPPKADTKGGSTPGAVDPEVANILRNTRASALLGVITAGRAGHVLARNRGSESTFEMIAKDTVAVVQLGSASATTGMDFYVMRSLASDTSNAASLSKLAGRVGVVANSLNLVGSSIQLGEAIHKGDPLQIAVSGANTGLAISGTTSSLMMLSNVARVASIGSKVAYGTGVGAVAMGVVDIGINLYQYHQQVQALNVQLKDLRTDLVNTYRARPSYGYLAVPGAEGLPEHYQNTASFVREITKKERGQYVYKDDDGTPWLKVEDSKDPAKIKAAAKKFQDKYEKGAYGANAELWKLKADYGGIKAKSYELTTGRNFDEDWNKHMDGVQNLLSKVWHSHSTTNEINGNFADKEWCAKAGIKGMQERCDLHNEIKAKYPLQAQRLNDLQATLKEVKFSNPDEWAMKKFMRRSVEAELKSFDEFSAKDAALVKEGKKAHFVDDYFRQNKEVAEKHLKGYKALPLAGLSTSPEELYAKAVVYKPSRFEAQTAQALKAFTEADVKVAAGLEKAKAQNALLADAVAAMGEKPVIRSVPITDDKGQPLKDKEGREVSFSDYIAGQKQAETMQKAHIRKLEDRMATDAGKQDKELAAELKTAQLGLVTTQLQIKEAELKNEGFKALQMSAVVEKYRQRNNELALLDEAYSGDFKDVEKQTMAKTKDMAVKKLEFDIAANDLKRVREKGGAKEVADAQKAAVKAEVSYLVAQRGALDARAEHYEQQLTGKFNEQLKQYESVMLARKMKELGVKNIAELEKKDKKAADDVRAQTVRLKNDLWAQTRSEVQKEMGENAPGYLIEERRLIKMKKLSKSLDENKEAKSELPGKARMNEKTAALVDQIKGTMDAVTSQLLGMKDMDRLPVEERLINTKNLPPKPGGNTTEIC